MKFNQRANSFRASGRPSCSPHAPSLLSPTDAQPDPAYVPLPPLLGVITKGLLPLLAVFSPPPSLPLAQVEPPANVKVAPIGTDVQPLDVFPQRSKYNLGLTETATLHDCPIESNCVSTTSFRSPNHFLSPFVYSGLDRRDKEILRTIRHLAESQDYTLVKTDVDKGYVYATRSTWIPGVQEDVELMFPPDRDRIFFRCISQVTLPPTPFCLTPGCINGNQFQRAHMEQLRDELGWISDDQTLAQEKQWLPIFFH
ncbi:unnamed protein product [Vitrella brassicaformis CCMP3155]|uniref:Uncharacterized protein n=2 Tax=Vitrella brassicaformis TaxID=1169539 RepID=A0A0G4H7I7_VITBC|nr:unnamed protein product [Vitrella brassicaformis CCMP3155]|mmetsp:Transcript_47061/g.117397  ORF Transcript_47061/g.117397 Transcript_47061/m.117397 type:complete len:255 (+) Transcript_47061:78-842(+)|eukprot:CEM39855.1 unnamed protein product [Vitrella brassicaformis CCMP3155]